MVRVWTITVSPTGNAMPISAGVPKSASSLYEDVDLRGGGPLANPQYTLSITCTVLGKIGVGRLLTS
jgi:hypothetical protein